MLWILEQVEAIPFSDLAPLLPRLSAARRERISAISHPPTQTQMLLAELLLRHALREEYGLTELPAIETREKGKPFFPVHPELCFNLSHCRTAVACVLDHAPVGVDVQDYRPLHSSDAASATPSVYRVLSEPERAWVTAGETPRERDVRFAAVWTCKEAYGKAGGEGLLYDLGSTAFVPAGESWQQYGCCFFHRSASDHSLCCCSLRPLESTPGSVTLPMLCAAL